MAEPSADRSDETGPEAGGGATSVPAPSLGAALGLSLLWLGAETALVWALTRAPLPLSLPGLAPGGALPLGAACSAALAITAPVAGALIWRGLARRSALTAAAAARAPKIAPAAPSPDQALSKSMAEGLTRSDLTHALAHAARDALDGERGAIARRIAELAETQRKLDEALARLAPADPAPAQLGSAAAEAPAQARDRAPAPAPAAAEPPAESPSASASPVSPSAPEPTPEPAPTAAAAQAEPMLPLDPAPARPAAPIPAAPQAPAAEDPQASLPLAGASSGAPAPGRDWGRIALALDFPRDEKDDAGWAALAEAARDRPIAELLQASEDALTLLAQHGVYMEDLRIRLASPELWARFAAGERGPDLRPVGGVEAGEAVETAKRMMKADPVFRDTAMHLMRRFDGVLRRAAAEPRGETRLPALADSRTGRAFMLIAQAVGTFD